MIQALRELLTTWEFRPEVLIVPLIFGYLYLRGWLHIHQVEAARLERGDRLPRRLAEPWRPLAYFGGIGVLLTALLSGLDSYGSLLFFIHMIQHLLIIMVAAPLIWLGNPYPFIMWGLPRPFRLRLGRLFTRQSQFRQALRSLSNPFLAWIYLVAATWVWHDPNLYDLALRDDLVHDLEHITFFVVGMIFWWHAVGAQPHFHRPMSYLKRVGYVLVAAPANMALGVAISFAGSPWYEHYTAVPRIWGVPVMDDQMYGGVIMWVPGSMMYLLAALALVAVHLSHEEKKAPLPASRWESKDNLLAPGLEKGAGGAGSQPLKQL